MTSAYSAALADYLALITGYGRGEGWIELRYRHSAGMRARFYRAERSLTSLQRRIIALSEHRDVFLGCALRVAQRGDRHHVGQAWALWAECDAPTARETLTAYTPTPTLMIASGTPGHVHAYWALAESVDADTLENANRRLAAAVGGDPVCYDSARILRPPGTFNHKHSPPAPVSQLAPVGRRSLQLSDVLERAPQVSRTVLRNRERRTASADRLLDIPPEDYIAELTGQAIGHDRKTSCPFHADQTPSLHAYLAPSEGWFCFGCRRGGTIYDLAAELWLSGQGGGKRPLRGEEFLWVRRRLLAMFSTTASDVTAAPTH